MNYREPSFGNLGTCTQWWHRSATQIFNVTFVAGTWND